MNTATSQTMEQKPKIHWLIRTMLDIGLISLLALMMSGPSALSATSPAKTVLSFDDPLGVDMPVWVHVRLLDDDPSAQMQANIRYPFGAEPWYFGDYAFEVTRDGKPLPKREATRQSFNTGGLSGGSVAPPTSPKNRFPLHLHYQFDKPGKYAVRLRRSVPLSDWTELEIRAFTVEQQRAWVKQTCARPPDSVGLLVGDYLPSLLAKTDEQVLPTILDQIYHPNQLVQKFAVFSLYYFSDDMVQRQIPLLIRKKGASDSLAYFLSWRRALLQPVGHDIVDSLIPFLKSNSGGEVGGALRALMFLKAHYSWKDYPNTPKRIEQAVAEASPHIMSFNDSETLQPLCLFLSGVKSDLSRDLLWELSANASVREQALICLGGMGDSRDLPRLAKVLLESDDGAEALPYQLRKAYGTNAIPCMLKAMHEAPDYRVRLYCARELAIENHPEAFAHFREILRHNLELRANVIQFLIDEFKIKREASDREILEFLDKRALPSNPK